MKVLLAIMRHDYGDPRRGESYELVNFKDPIERLGHEVIVFDYLAELNASSRDAMNARLLQLVVDERPDVAIFSLYTDQILPETVAALRTMTKTFCFFHDDTWRVEFSRFWASQFEFFSSPDIEAKHIYPPLGLSNVFYFPFGANEVQYRPTVVEPDIDVSFVGQWHPYRAWLVARLRKAGLNVVTAGYGWPEGMANHERMVELFNRSRINLNLSNSASWDIRYVLSGPRAARDAVRSVKRGEQLKARPFEIAACGGFVLSYYVNGLEKCFDIGEEIGVYLDPDDMLDKIRYYLADDPLRRRIAGAGYQRVLGDHTYSKRFEALFDFMGLEGGRE